MDDICAVIFYAALCALAGLSILGLSMFLGPRRRKRGKLAPYECGAPPLTAAGERAPVQFYMVALAFVLFDVELLFLIPYAVTCAELGRTGLCEMLAFVAVLGVGLLYAIRRGVLEWE